MRVTKHHGLGNDFLVVVDPTDDLGPATARAWCDRRTGFGADGLVLAVTDGLEGGIDGQFVLFNADGSRAAISGNGLRCMVQALHDAKRVGDAGVVHTAAGPRAFEVGEEIGAHGVLVTVDMGAPLRSEVPDVATPWIPEGVEAHAVDVGNPHVVLLVGDLDAVDLTVVGPAIDAAVPGGTNVHAVRRVGGDAVDMRIWERGVGTTFACGSGAIAAAATVVEDPTEHAEIEVQMVGGIATVHTGSPFRLTGPSQFVGEVVPA